MSIKSFRSLIQIVHSHCTNKLLTSVTRGISLLVKKKTTKYALYYVAAGGSYIVYNLTEFHCPRVYVCNYIHFCYYLFEN